MPSPRKRIGFLPSSDVQIIIEKICEHNKLSQSKVTGILVEEALRYRGVLKNVNTNLSRHELGIFDKLSIQNYQTLNNDTNKDDKNLIFTDGCINEDFQMISDYIKFKYFKKIMKNNESI